MKKIWKVIILVFVSAVMAGDLILDFRRSAQAQPLETVSSDSPDLVVGTSVGELAPDFIGTTIDGQKVMISELRGKQVLVNVFASWCGPCRVETPHLVDVYNNIDRDKVEFIGLNLQERSEEVEFFRDEFFVPYPLVLNERGDLTRVYRPIGLPTTWFIDRDGVVRFVFSGPMTREALESILTDVEAGREPDPFAGIG
jgi:thiol-disulfide isomerase/thioredoxin